MGEIVFGSNKRRTDPFIAWRESWPGSLARRVGNPFPPSSVGPRLYLHLALSLSITALETIDRGGREGVVWRDRLQGDERGGGGERF